MPTVFHLRDLPKYETLLKHAQRYPLVDISAIETCLEMLAVSREVISAFDDHLGGMGISQGRFTVLMLLNRDPEHPLSPAELADRSGVTRATMTGLMEGLERDGLVSREDDPNDRRRHFIHLTDKGRRFLDQVMPDYFKRSHDLMDHLSEDERQQLRELLKRVRQRVPALRE